MTELTQEEKAGYALRLADNPLINNLLDDMRSAAWQAFLQSTTDEELRAVQADVLAINTLETKIAAEIAVAKDLKRRQESLDKAS